MALADYVYRLKPQSGDSTPHDEKGAGGDLSGGTIALTDLGGGVYCWRFTGSRSSASAPSRTVNFGTTGTGFTVALRVAFNSYPSSGDTRIVNYSAAVDPTASSWCYRYAGSTVAYASMRDSGSTTFLRVPSASNIDVGTTMRTLVMRVKASSVASSDYHELWWSGGGAGPGSDHSTNVGVSDVITLDTISVDPQGGTIDVRDWVIWHEELSDADCDSLRDDIDTALGGGGGPTAAIKSQMLLKACS